MKRIPATRWSAWHMRCELEKLKEKNKGWICHYCGCKLLTPEELTDDKGRYKYQAVYWRDLYPNQRKKWPKLDYTKVPVRDHMIPQSRKGPTQLWNLILCCMRCNSRKNNKSYIEFVFRFSEREK